MNVQEKLSKIQQEFKAKKSRYNSFGKYNFRSAEDILEGLKPMIEKYNVYFTVDEEVVHIDSSVPLIRSRATIVCCESQEHVSVDAVVGVDLQQKGMQVPQAFGSASSYGKKYALGNLLLIDDTADADATNTHGRDKANASSQKKKLTATIIANMKKAVAGGNSAAVEAKLGDYDCTPAQRKDILG